MKECFLQGLVIMKNPGEYARALVRAVGKVLATQTAHRGFPEKDQLRFQNQRVRENSRNARIGALGMVIFNAAAALFFLLGFGGLTIPHAFEMHLFEIYVADILIGIAFLVATGVLNRKRKESVVAWNVAIVFLLVWTFLSAVAIDNAHQDHSNHITNIQLALFMSALLITLKPSASIISSVAVALAAFLFIWRVQPDPFMKTLTFGNIIFTVVASFIFSRIQFANKVATFLHIRTIEAQNQEIQEGRLRNHIFDFVIDNKLSPREGEILPLLIRGLSNQAIADMVFVSLDTVKKHVYNIYRKASVENRLSLLRKIESTPDRGTMDTSDPA